MSKRSSGGVGLLLRKRYGFIGPAIVFALLAGILGAERSEPALDFRLSEFDALDRKAKDQWLIDTKVRERTAFELEVLRRLETATTDEQRVDMATLIGLYHTGRAADALCARINLMDWRHQTLVRESLWPMNSSQYALYKLGSAANPALLRLVARTDDRMEMRLAVSVLRGQGVPVAEALLRAWKR